MPSAAKMRVMDVIQDHQKVAELQASVAALAAQLKEQAAEIAKGQRADAGEQADDRGSSE